MIYVDMVFAVIFLCYMVYSAYVGLKTEGKEHILWIAAATIFANTAIDLATKIAKHYEEQPAVKEVRV